MFYLRMFSLASCLPYWRLCQRAMDTLLPATCSSHHNLNECGPLFALLQALFFVGRFTSCGTGRVCHINSSSSTLMMNEGLGSSFCSVVIPTSLPSMNFLALYNSLYSTLLSLAFSVALDVKVARFPDITSYKPFSLDLLCRPWNHTLLRRPRQSWSR
ncbi:hypothetical protein BJ165DRAFT_925499 [Panaeolus papilionaceus]|nr:hypothetical protein BJ165DRAFT_925499 [Panaeolus papilionaceus]